MPGTSERIEQRTRLRGEPPPASATLLVRGGPDSAEKLRRHAERTARAWALDGRPLFGISVFAVLDVPLGSGRISPSGYSVRTIRRSTGYLQRSVPRNPIPSTLEA